MPRDNKRAGETRGLASFMAGERTRILDAATPERREQMHAAEGARRVYEAWNAVCGGTREGAHVTGLRYLPETNELLVYLDGDTWVTEMTLLREIIRARMAIKGVDISGFVFRVSRPEYAQRAAAKRASGAAAGARVEAVPPRRVVHEELDAQTRAAIDSELAPIADDRLRDALNRAMVASLTTKVSND